MAANAVGNFDPIEFEREWTAYECVICMEHVVEKNNYFAVLNCCDHIYCFQCVLQLSSFTSRVRQPRRCPICRRNIRWFVPSPLPVIGADKLVYIDKYRKAPGGKILWMYENRATFNKRCPIPTCTQKFTLADGRQVCHHTVYNPSLKMAKIRKHWVTKNCSVCSQLIVEKADCFGQLYCCPGLCCFDCCARILEQKECSKCSMSIKGMRAYVIMGKKSVEVLLYEAVGCAHWKCFSESEAAYQPCPIPNCTTTIEFEPGYFLCKHGYCDDRYMAHNSIFNMIQRNKETIIKNIARCLMDSYAGILYSIFHAIF